MLPTPKSPPLQAHTSSRYSKAPVLTLLIVCAVGVVFHFPKKLNESVPSRSAFHASAATKDVTPEIVVPASSNSPTPNQFTNINKLAQSTLTMGTAIKLANFR